MSKAGLFKRLLGRGGDAAADGAESAAGGLSGIINPGTIAAGAGVGALTGQYAIEDRQAQAEFSAIDADYQQGIQNLQASIAGAEKIIADWDSMSSWGRIWARIGDAFNGLIGTSDGEAEKSLVERVAEARVLVNGDETNPNSAAHKRAELLTQFRSDNENTTEQNTGRGVIQKQIETLDYLTGGEDVDGVNFTQGALLATGAVYAGARTIGAVRTAIGPAGIETTNVPRGPTPITNPARLIAPQAGQVSAAAARAPGKLGRIASFGSKALALGGKLWSSTGGRLLGSRATQVASGAAVGTAAMASAASANTTTVDAADAGSLVTDAVDLAADGGELVLSGTAATATFAATSTGLAAAGAWAVGALGVTISAPLAAAAAIGTAAAVTADFAQATVSTGIGAARGKNDMDLATVWGNTFTSVAVDGVSTGASFVASAFNGDDAQPATVTADATPRRSLSGPIQAPA